MLHYLLIIRPGTPETTVPPPDAQVERMKVLMKEMTMAGALLAFEGCLPTAHGAKLRYDPSGEHHIVDGPFSDLKQIVGGVMLVQAKTKADAVGWAKKLLTELGEGEIEVRLLASS